MIKSISVMLCSFAAMILSANAQPPVQTPVNDLGLKEVPVEIPAKFTGLFPANVKLRLPEGFKVRVFYTGGLNKPRFMSFDAHGILHVTDMNTGGAGKVYALPDKNHDGAADSAILVSQGYTNNHDVKFYRGDMYVTETTKVWKCTDADHDGIYESKAVFIDNIAGGATTGHITRTLVFDSINRKAYLSIGSSCNVCRENNRAIIEQYEDDGTGRRIFATGSRNAVGMALHPSTNRLWANNNGSDNQGNETPPEWIDVVRDGGFYGHPFAYGDRNWFNFDVSDYAALKPITSTDSAKVNTMVPPAALIRAHSAPMALQFLHGGFPQLYRRGFLVALRGSWNTTAPDDYRGYKVIYADLSDNQDTTVNFVADFCTGFLTDSVNRVYWGRPVGLAVDGSGNIYVSSDEENKFILQIYPADETGLNEQSEPVLSVSAAYPNPFGDHVTIPFLLNEPAIVVTGLYDVAGREVQQTTGEKLNAGDHRITLDAKAVESGFYFIRIKAGNQVLTQKLSCIK